MSEVLRLAVTHQATIWRATGLALGAILVIGVVAVVRQTVSVIGGDSHTTCWPKTGQQVRSVSVSGEKGALSPDDSKLWVVTSSGQLQEVDLVRGVIGRTGSLPAAGETCAPCVPLQRLHASADGRTLFVPAAPGAPELRATGRASVVWMVATSTLLRVAAVPLPEPAFDSAPTSDGSALLESTVVAPPDRQTSWLLAVPSGRELVKWPRSVCCLYVLPTPAP
jgi:hypothetical protein